MAFPADIHFIAALPSAALGNKVRLFSKEFADRFDSSHCLRSIPHISMVNSFRLNPEKIKTLTLLIRNKLADYQPFETRLSGFGGYPERTIFIRVMDKKPFVFLSKLTNSLIKANLGSAPGYVSDPHLTVANKDLAPENYLRALPEFEARIFEETMAVNSIFLLRLDHGWKVAAEFPLSGSKDYEPAQQNLFAPDLFP